MPRKVRPIRVCGGVAYVTLTQGYEAIIGAADVPLVESWNWFAMVQSHTVYAIRKEYNGTKQRTICLHRVVMGEPEGLQVDHEDGDGLNNQRYNLRVASSFQNSHNRRVSSNNKSGFKGVCWNKGSGKWLAQIGFNSGKKYLGLFTSPEEAHAAYCQASKKYHGEFGRTS
jgi:hypothetical protein